jgi:type I restriction-modification system DNA methylase subunit
MAKTHEANQVVAEIEENGIELSIKDMEAIFERLIDCERKKTQGAVYTPDHIIDYLILESMKNTPSSAAMHILDPACGSGGFLIRAASLLETQLHIPLEQAIRRNICGVDNDPGAIKHAKCLFDLLLGQRGAFVHPDDMNLVCADMLLASPQHILGRLGCPAGADIVATNPPYVKLQTLDETYRKNLISRYPEYTRYNFSLALLFLVVGRKLLANNGSLAFITQNNLFTSLAGEEARKHLQEDLCIWRIVDFGHHRVFRSALAYTCLVFIDTKEHNEIQFSRIEKNVSLDELLHCHFEPIKASSLKPKKWRLAKSTQQANLKKIETIGTPLGVLAEIKVGFATLKDKVFFVDDSQNGYCIARHPSTNKEYLIERDITVPAVRVADIRCDGDLDRVSRRLIFPYIHVKGRHIIFPEKALIKSFPKAYTYLMDCRTLLERRDKGRKSYEAWYAWARTQGREALGPKLLTKTFSSRPQFFLDPTDRLFCNGYAVFPPKADLFATRISIEVLKILLESSVMHYYAKLTSFQIEGNYQCYQKNFIERFGIPHLTDRMQMQIRDASQEDREAMIADIYAISQDDLAAVVGTVWRQDKAQTSAVLCKP